MNKLLQGSWKTTVFGVAAALLAAWQVYDFGAFNWKTFASATALALWAYFTRDNNKSSEDVGAKN